MSTTSVSVTYMSAATVAPEVQVDGTKVGELKGVGTYGGGVYGAGWVENVIAFDKADGSDMELRLKYVGTANYQDWYFDNLRLYRIEGTSDGIEAQSGCCTTASQADFLQELLRFSL